MRDGGDEDGKDALHVEFKQERVRLAESEQSVAAAARILGVVEQTLFNWVKAR